MAWAAGVLTPRLIAFDDSRTIVDRPFSLRERAHGETLGNQDLAAEARREVWREAAGEQVARLHQGVRACPDPEGYLEDALRELRLDRVLQQFADCGRGGRALVRLIGELTPFVSRRSVADCLFTTICTRGLFCAGERAGCWPRSTGDAGWGDPTLDFAAVPLECLAAALEGDGGLSHWASTRRLSLCGIGCTMLWTIRPAGFRLHSIGGCSRTSVRM